jgi:Mn-dependent DtxR family transcriptional regulator
MPQMTVTKEEIFEFIKEFYERYRIVPCTGFLAGYLKITPHVVLSKLKQLDEEKKIKRIKAAKINTSYIII